MKTIAGVDEVGRGSLIGPVYAAAVILNKSINKKLLKEAVAERDQLMKEAREMRDKMLADAKDDAKDGHATSRVECFESRDHACR